MGRELGRREIPWMLSAGWDLQHGDAFMRL